MTEREERADRERERERASETQKTLLFNFDAHSPTKQARLGRFLLLSRLFLLSHEMIRFFHLFAAAAVLLLSLQVGMKLKQ